MSFCLLEPWSPSCVSSFTFTDPAIGIHQPSLHNVVAGNGIIIIYPCFLKNYFNKELLKIEMPLRSKLINLWWYDFKKQHKVEINISIFMVYILYLVVAFQPWSVLLPSPALPNPLPNVQLKNLDEWEDNVGITRWDINNSNFSTNENQVIISKVSMWEWIWTLTCVSREKRVSFYAWEKWSICWDVRSENHSVNPTLHTPRKRVKLFHDFPF